MVQEVGKSSSWAARQTLARRSQVGPALRLVAWLKQRFGVPMRDVIGQPWATVAATSEIGGFGATITPTGCGRRQRTSAGVCES